MSRVSILPRGCLQEYRSVLETTPPADLQDSANLQDSTGGAQASFHDLGLSEVMLSAVAAAGYIEPTPVQAGFIPRALSGVDVMGQARTGTGKTAAFSIPVIDRLKPREKGGGPQALVLVPTRELAVQVHGEVHKLSLGSKTRCVALYGGKPIRGQIDKLNRGVDIVVGTPGRVIDHIGRGTLVLKNVAYVILDEADRMLDIGFRPDIEKILRRCPQDRQTMLLSATVPPPVERLAKRYMRDPEILNFSSKDVSVDTIEQFYFTVEPTKKFDLLDRLIEREKPRRAIVFCRTKRGTEKVRQRLSKRHSSVNCIHGDMMQSARDRVMQQFRAGSLQILVATDVVGRGIDVSGISHIINYDMPQFCDDYIHRVGRTGRMGREGVAYSFVLPEEGNELTRIEMRINRLLHREEIEGITTVAKRPPTQEEREAEVATKRAQPAPPTPPGKRPRRRHRRAL